MTPPTVSPDKFNDFLEKLRMALLMQVDAIERLMEMEHRTSELRKWHKEHQWDKKNTSYTGDGLA